MSDQPEDQKADDLKRIERMDKVAEHLMDLISKETTTDAQKGRLFQQVQSWLKLRPTLIPVEQGSKLKEMSHGLNAKGGKRSGSAARGGGSSGAGAGRKISAIIRSLPRYGNDTGGDQKDSVGAGGGARGNGGRVLSDGELDVLAKLDESGDSGLVRHDGIPADGADRLPDAKVDAA
jgi:hypothetical protein